ncbi:hypothetical protein [Antrihabitans cavernicola]|uniref:Uncharacterized protein n=1 Tax=Antrihabitans cavernicola TaxID=2495913 RepID=A0A5A7S8F5_9NOCA|nr:hypothetical protein [Spelaeibacter cavernicola]KAA0021432.1 hypothetical protein FOY51_19545 [Spelaeibacter cavernicola]
MSNVDGVAPAVLDRIRETCRSFPKSSRAGVGGCAVERDAFAALGFPYFLPNWSPSIVGLSLDDATDWDELAELLTESYCLVAPKSWPGW